MLGFSSCREGEGCWGRAGGQNWTNTYLDTICLPQHHVGLAALPDVPLLQHLL